MNPRNKGTDLDGEAVAGLSNCPASMAVSPVQEKISRSPGVLGHRLMSIADTTRTMNFTTREARSSFRCGGVLLGWFRQQIPHAQRQPRVVVETFDNLPGCPKPHIKGSSTCVRAMI